MDRRIRFLHCMARTEGRCVQSHIDSYLAAVGYLLQSPSDAAFARMMVMSPADSPQEGALPDLGFMLRVVMMQTFTEVRRGGKARDGRREAQCESDCGVGQGTATSGGELPKDLRALAGGGRKALGRCVGPALHWSHTPSLGVREDDFSVQMTLRVFPCLRRSSQRMCSVRSGEQVGLCVLLGLVLGLYPHAAKFPPFSVRVFAFCSVHRLITGGGGAAFCASFPMLFTLAYMEYFAHVVPSYMPAEMDVLCREAGVASFFSSCPLVCDVFRQEMLNEFGGGFDWAALESYCAGVVDKHVRACKNRFKGKKESAVGVRVDAVALNAFGGLPLIVPYDLHQNDAGCSIIGSELAFLMDGGARCGFGVDAALGPVAPVDAAGVPFDPDSGGGSVKATCGQPGDSCISVAMMQRLIRVDALPRNMTMMQLRALHARMRQCERSAVDAMYLYMCVSCSFVKGVQRVHQIRGQCKLQVCAGGGVKTPLMCSSCKTLSVVAVNALGRVVSIRQHRYYLAPCCLSVQLYQSAGVEFQTEFCDPTFFGEEIMARMAWRPDIRPEMCHHSPGGIKQQGKPQRPQCDVCVGKQSGYWSDAFSQECSADSGVAGRPATGGGSRSSASLETFSFVDHLTGQMRVARLCQRHTPHSGVMRHVVNWSQFVQEVLQRGRGC